MFKRKPRTWGRTFLEFFYPRGGWYRTAQYVIHRIRRLPDPAHRISRGVASGVFVCFTPFFGLHFVLATAIAWAIRGNILAALLATFVGNPLTFPIIAEVSLEIGSRLMGLPQDVHLPQIFEAFSHAIGDIWRNFLAVFSADQAEWHGIGRFWDRVMLPYFVGGIAPGLMTALAAYFVTTPIITAYQKRRVKRLKKRYDKRIAEAAGRAEEVSRAKAGDEPAKRARKV